MILYKARYYTVVLCNKILNVRITYIWANMSTFCYIFATLSAMIISIIAQPGIPIASVVPQSWTPVLTPPVSGTVGSTYVRWGRADCPATASLVYKGFVGKSNFNQGGGVNYLCLPENPEWPTGANSGLQSGSYMYGAEYQHQSSPVWSSTVHDQDAPCALCRVAGRTLQIMVPAKKTCPTGWTREYYGLLVAQHYSQRSSDFVCLDLYVQYLFGGYTNQDGGLFYTVEGRCGSLKCPPYVEGYELSCVVCTA